MIPEQKQEVIIQKKIAAVSLQILNGKYSKEREQNEYLDNLFAQLALDVNFFNRDAEEMTDANNKLKNYQLIYLELLDQQRKLLDEMNRRAEFDEELIRKYLLLIDLEEYKLREKLL